MKIIKVITLAFLTLSVLSCANDSEDDLVDVVDNPGNNPDGSQVTYVDNIEPIIQSSCTGCHANPPRNGAPFPLINFSQVSQRAGGILNRMSRQSGTPGAMPPSGRLPQSTRDLVDEWIKAGTPERKQ